MTLKINGNDIYDNHGKWLKTIACPKKVRLSDLEANSQNNFSCQFCEREIHNTDFMSENEVENLIKEKPTVCLSINLKNPIFERLE